MLQQITSPERACVMKTLIYFIKNNLMIILLTLITICLLKISFGGIDITISNRYININTDISNIDIDGYVEVRGSSDPFSKPIDITVSR
jgi:hypothetical protein